MTLPTGKFDLNEYGKYLAEKSAEIYEEKTKQAVDAMERHRQECLARDAKWQAIIDRSGELLKEKKERKLLIKDRKKTEEMCRKVFGPDNI